MIKPFLLAVLAVTSGAALAQTSSNAVTWQGRLMHQGQPYHGEIGVEVRYFDAAEGGNETGSEDIFLAEVRQGLLQIVLKPTVDFHAQQTWLEFSVFDPEDFEMNVLAPRQLVTTVPMAMTAYTANRALEPFDHDPMSGTLAYHFGESQFRLVPAGSATLDAPNVIVGNVFNTVSGSGSAVLSGGQRQSFNAVDGDGSVIAGGSGHAIQGDGNAIVGGYDSIANGLASSVGGGISNAVHGNAGHIGGGWMNTVGQDFAVVSGGAQNCAGARYSWAGGRRAKVRPGAASITPGMGCTGVPLNPMNDYGDSGTFIWADSQNANFTSTGPDRFLVRATGGIGFGRNPEDWYDIDAPFDPAMGDGSGEQGVLRVRMNNNTKFRVLRNGGVAIGNSFSSSGVPADGLRVSGETRLDSDMRLHSHLWVDGTVRVDFLAHAGGSTLCHDSNNRLGVCISARRFKDHIRSLEGSAQLVSRLRPVRFRWIDDAREDIGLIAEEVAAVIPELVVHGGDGEIQGVNYRHLTAVLIGAVQAQQVEKAGLQRQVDDLEHRLAALEAVLRNDGSSTSRQ